ncbi:hypothetical protein PSEUBRA_001502 [Kalmanozyma brasiliensis GHG001]|uniref:uncharacterized protein n=1 Tax=Kalmanozyma brasiliensis (strain GHG001) TaxID=1365824 RepID=UPI002867CDEF|nr:uncharacterized protein PSEUBRA_001502 [Kalmanozyma brasiliensis GHG001]KAF6766949.1 hypothetical protein PSEUBRA_001502 [Kalmanozyma brasiliensis GHG001]
MARGSSPSLNGDSTNDSGIILKSKSPAGNEVANVASSSRMTLLSQTARPARPARPSQPAASTKAEQLASPPMKMQKYFYKDEYHNVPLVPVMDDEGRRKLFNDVRRVMIEKSIDKELLGDSASRAEILELHEKYDDVLWQALGI